MAESLDSFLDLSKEEESAALCQACGQKRPQPCPCRWPVWTAAVSLWEQLPLNYEELLQGEGPEDRQIELDIGRTSPQLGEEGQQMLCRVLRAYAALRPDVGYCQGMNFVAGLLVLVSNRQEEDSFRVLACLMDNYNLAGFYRSGFPLLKRYVIAADRVLLLESPSLHSHLLENRMEPYLYMHEWFLSLFVDCMPPALVLDIFDAITDKGLFIVIPIAISILRTFEATLLSLPFEGIFRFLKAIRNNDEQKRDDSALELRSVVDRACAIKVPLEILDYLSGESEELPELPVEEEVEGSRFVKAMSRAFSSLSPKKRRMRREAERNERTLSPQKRPSPCDVSAPEERSFARGLLSPKKRPSLIATSPCEVAAPRDAPFRTASLRGLLSPKKKRHFLENFAPCDSSAPSATPSLAVASPCRRSQAVARSLSIALDVAESPCALSPRTSSPCGWDVEHIAPTSPSKWMRAQPSAEREVEMICPDRGQRCIRQRPLPQQLTLEEAEHEDKCDAPLKQSTWRAPCCGTQKVASPCRRRPSSQSPSKRSCTSSHSPSKRSCNSSHSPSKRSCTSSHSPNKQDRSPVKLVTGSGSPVRVSRRRSLRTSQRCDNELGES